MLQGVVGVVRRGEEVLVVRRATGVPFAGLWAPVSGKVELGEEPADAVVREVREEVGLEVRPISKVWECPSSDGVYWLHWWIVEPVADEVVLELDAREVESARWILPAEFGDLEDVFPADAQFFAEVLPEIRD